jgi:signal transduction histidine kinase/CheY-like chemotaxis protein
MAASDPSKSAFFSKYKSPEELAFSLIEALPGPNVLVLLDDSVLAYSASCLPYFGTSAFPGHSISRLFSPGDWNTLSPYLSKAKTGESHTHEGVVTFTGNGPQHVRLFFRPLLSANGEPTAVIVKISDHQEVQHLQSDLAEAARTAQAGEVAKNLFIANMTHELRTPLNAILGFASLMARPEVTADQRKEYSKIISRSGEVLVRLLSDTLDLAKAESGKVAICKDRLSIYELIDELCAIFQHQCESRLLNFKVNTGLIHFPDIICDRVRVKQILSNLLSNAIKATSAGSVTLTVAREDSSPPVYNFSVTDTGMGISSEDASKLFKPFSQVGSSNQSSGTGLGLCLSRKLARLLGGDLALTESALGQGSTFQVRIPVDEIAAPDLRLKQGSQAVLAAESEQPFLGRRFLVVEDIEDNWILLNELLKNLGGQAFRAEDGLIGVQMASSERYDMILMDLNMPRMDGYEATRCLRSQLYSGPIVALSASVTKATMQECKSMGCNDFISKPFSTRVLVQKLGPLLPRS